MRNVDRPSRAGTQRSRQPGPQAREPRTDNEEASEGAARRVERGFLFEDPYWDDAFCSYYDPTLRTCCGR